jgi:hypothetical protein
MLNRITKRTNVRRKKSFIAAILLSKKINQSFDWKLRHVSITGQTVAG